MTGFWKEFYCYDFIYSIKDDLEYPEIRADKEKILNFLNSGTWVISTRGLVFCPVTKIYLGTGTLYTDGHWLWTESLIQYFIHYDIPLNQSFLKHIRRCNYKCDQVSKKSIIELNEKVHHLKKWEL